MEKTDVKLTAEYIRDNYLRKTYQLVEADRQDNLSEHTAEIQLAIQEQQMDAFYEIIDDVYYTEASQESLNYIVNELKDDLDNEFDSDEIDEFFQNEENVFAVEEYIMNRDTSDLLKDLMCNTNGIVAHYSSDVDVEYGYDDEAYKNNMRSIKKFLKIKMRNHTWDKQLSQMLSDASYGGYFVVYFLIDDIKDFVETKDVKTITFKNPNVAVIDLMNGSGGDTQLPGLELTVKFDPKNIYLDKNQHYNYTYDVCSMSSNWCDDTIVKLNKK